MHLDAHYAEDGTPHHLYRATPGEVFASLLVWATQDRSSVTDVALLTTFPLVMPTSM